MGRGYSASFKKVSVAAIQDLLSLKANGKAIRILSIDLAQETSKTVDILSISLRRISGTVVDGSGGTVVTPVPRMSSDVASSVTAHANDTVQASGTIVTEHASAWNVVNGYQFFWAPGTEPIIAPGETAVLSLDTAPTGSPATYVASGTIEFEEMF